MKFRIEFERKFGSNETIEEAIQNLPSYSEPESKWIFTKDFKDSVAKLIESGKKLNFFFENMELQKNRAGHKF